MNEDLKYAIDFLTRAFEKEERHEQINCVKKHTPRHYHLQKAIGVLQRLHWRDELIALNLPKWMTREDALQRIIDTECVSGQLVNWDWETGRFEVL